MDRSDTVAISDSTVERYGKWLPLLSRLEIFDVILSVGPARSAIEAELQRRAVRVAAGAEAFPPRESTPGDKPELTPGQLFGLMKGLLALARTVPCDCKVPLPTILDHAPPDAPNWRIDAPRPCKRGCHRLIQEIAAGIGARFDMTPAGGRRDRCAPAAS